MSQNKSGIKIVETEAKLMICGGEGFCEKASATKEILHSLEADRTRPVSILLSPKSKNFQDTFFLIRHKIMTERLKHAQILLTSHSGTSFKQIIDENNNLYISTRDYTLHSNPVSGKLSIKMTHSGKVFANEDIAKEITSAIALEKPQKVDIFFVRGENEKHDAYVKRIKNLENYFISKATELYSIKQLRFSIGTKGSSMLISSYTRSNDSFALLCEEQHKIPEKHSKHKRILASIITENKTNTIV